MIEVPEVVANKARSLGADGWLADLGELISEIELDWGLTVGQAHRDGTEAWVGEAIDHQGCPGVLKLCIPRPGGDPWVGARREATVLERNAGRSCVGLRRIDVDRGALLLDRLGPSMADLGVAFPARMEILCHLVSLTWDAPSGLGWADGAEKASELAASIEVAWEELDRPCSAAAVDAALAAALRRTAAHDPERVVLAHGDVHQWNALQSAPGKGPRGWKLIDPDGLVVEREYDLGVLLREDPDELLADIEGGDPRRRARWLAARTATDADAIWDWGLIERVSTGLLATRIGLQPVGDQMLLAADCAAEVA